MRRNHNFAGPPASAPKLAAAPILKTAPNVFKATKEAGKAQPNPRAEAPPAMEPTVGDQAAPMKGSAKY